MFTVMMLMGVGAAGFVLSEMLDDSSDSETEPDEDTGTPEVGPEGDNILVSVDGGDAEEVAPEDVYLTTRGLVDGELFVNRSPEDDTGFVGTQADEVIRTNTQDDVYQTIRGGGGDDMVVMGAGDHADLLTLGDTSDEMTTEDDTDLLQVEFSEEDLEGATTIEFRESNGYMSVEFDEGDTPLFTAQLGSNDDVEISLPDGMTGSISILEGVETNSLGGGGSGAELESYVGLVMYVPEGMTFPEGVSYDEGSLWVSDDDAELTQEDFNGILVLGELDLGSEVSEGWYNGSTDEPPAPDEPIPDGWTLGWDHVMAAPSVLVVRPNT